MSCIAPSSHVTLHYRMAVLIEGTERELVNTFGAAPATLQMGVGQWAPTVEVRLIGLSEGQGLEFELPPDQAYGVRQPDLVHTVSRAQLQAQCEPGVVFAPGESIVFRGAGGESYRGVLARCDAQQAVVDFNHPLAGMPMRVRVQVIGVL
ncbi:MAG TPA: FKBP-type peptidyl-prolyl cis-trans isomerase [Burkholderiaceae bacterium]|nr:FKBP-type peptidyl-prolyl cis-trans isomerase [Burkholderiaceae bacterium]